MVVQPGLCGTRSETPKTGFLTTRLIGCSLTPEDWFSHDTAQMIIMMVYEEKSKVAYFFKAVVNCSHVSHATINIFYKKTVCTGFDIYTIEAFCNLATDLGFPITMVSKQDEKQVLPPIFPMKGNNSLLS